MTKRLFIFALLVSGVCQAQSAEPQDALVITHREALGALLGAEKDPARRAVLQRRIHALGNQIGQR